jgi:hypothetical protein
LTLHKALIKSVLTYACPAWEFAADTRVMKLQRLQNRGFRSIGNFPRRTSVRELHMDVKIPCIYDYIYQNFAGSKQKSYTIMEIQMFVILYKAKTDTKNIRGLNLAAIKLTIVQVTKLLL